MIKQTIPRQLPADVDGAALQQQAAAMKDAVEALVIVQIFIQIFAQGSSGEIKPAFFIIQIACFFTIYAVKIPANTEIYIDEFRKLIKFDAISPEHLMAKFFPNFTVDKFMNSQQ